VKVRAKKEKGELYNCQLNIIEEFILTSLQKLGFVASHGIDSGRHNHF